MQLQVPDNWIEEFEAKAEAAYAKGYKNDYVSDQIVMASAAGWYVGTVYMDREQGFIGPYSRDSEYYSTAEGAKEYLDYLNLFEEITDSLVL